MDQDFLMMKRMKNGDSQALEDFVRKYYGKILCYCRFHVSDAGCAEDLTQETFERFFRAVDGYRHYGKAVNYLYVISGNLCRDFYRKKKEIAMCDLPESEGESMGSIECHMDVKNAVQQLPPELRNVIILHYFQELKLKEIAKILDIGLPLVKYRMGKARQQLGIFLGEEEST